MTHLSRPHILLNNKTFEKKEKVMFPYPEATWDVVDGAMFMGWGTALPGITTFLAIVACVLVLVIGQRSETAKAKAFDK